MGQVIPFTARRAAQRVAEQKQKRDAELAPVMQALRDKDAGAFEIALKECLGLDMFDMAQSALRNS
jgi:hypothetical protein